MACFKIHSNQWVGNAISQNLGDLCMCPHGRLALWTCPKGRVHTDHADPCQLASSLLQCLGSHLLLDRTSGCLAEQALCL